MNGFEKQSMNEITIFLELANTVRERTHVHSCIRDYSGLFGTSNILKLKADWLVFPALIQMDEISIYYYYYYY